jgi:rubrerythrin
VDFENRSIRFYSGLKKAVPSSDQKQIDEIIAQEHEHIRRLEALRDEKEKRVSGQDAGS